MIAAAAAMDEGPGVAAATFCPRQGTAAQGFREFHRFVSTPGGTPGDRAFKVYVL